MPIYAYKCSSCGHAADVLQKMSADALTDCPSCGQSSYAKQVTAPSFQLKSSGWYVTDFKGEKKPAAATAATDAKTESAVDKSDTAAKENTKDSTKVSTNESTKESPAKSATESSSTAAAPTSIPTPTSAPAKPAVANA